MDNNSLNRWNRQNKKPYRKHFKERDIVFISIGENIGFEQNGKGSEFLRPVLIYKKFSSETFLGIPLTSKPRNSKFYVNFTCKDIGSTAILSQIRLFDAKRIAYFYGRISVGNFNFINKKLIELLQ